MANKLILFGMGKNPCEIHRGWDEGEFQDQIFEIGLGRVGSRSICEATRILGFRSKHGFNGCKSCANDAVFKFLDGRCDLDLYRTCEYAGEIPSWHWRKLADFYPNAKFVLPTRPVDQLIKKHGNKRASYNGYRKQAMYQPIGWSQLNFLKCFGQVTFEENLWRRKFVEHVQRAIDHIDDKRLLVLSVFEMDSEELWSKLATFLDRPIPDVPFPNMACSNSRISPYKRDEK